MGHLLGLPLGAQGCERAEGIPGPAAGAAAVGAERRTRQAALKTLGGGGAAVGAPCS